MIVAGSGTTAGKVYKIVPTVVDENIVWTKVRCKHGRQRLIIEALVEQVKNGDIALEQIPDVWRDKVQER